MQCPKCGYIPLDQRSTGKRGEPSASELPEKAVAPGTAPTPRRRRWVLVVLNGLLLFAGIGGFLFHRHLTSMRDGALWAANRYFVLQERAAFHDIYRTSSPGFRQGLSEEDFYHMMLVVASRLGRLTQRSLAGWRSLSNGSNGSSVMLQYASQYENGRAVETLTFIWDGTDWRLQGYNITSPALLSF